MADAEQSQQGQPQEQSEEELRAQLEEEIRKVNVADVILQSVVSILNLAARRIAKDDERDLQQGKLGIDAARSLVDLIPEEAQPQLRQAISELQLLYAKHAEGGEGAAPGEGDAAPGEGAEGEPAAQAAQERAEPPPEPGKPAKDSGLWTPPGT